MRPTEDAPTPLRRVGLVGCELRGESPARRGGEQESELPAAGPRSGCMTCAAERRRH